MCSQTARSSVAVFIIMWFVNLTKFKQKQAWTLDWPQNLKNRASLSNKHWASQIQSNFRNKEYYPNPVTRMVEGLVEPKNLITRPAQCFVCYQPITTPFMMRVGASTLQSWKKFVSSEVWKPFFPLFPMKAFTEWIFYLILICALFYCIVFPTLSSCTRNAWYVFSVKHHWLTHALPGNPCQRIHWHF